MNLLNFHAGSETRDTCDRVTTALVSSTTVFLVTSVVFILIGFLCGRFMLSRSNEQSSKLKFESKCKSAQDNQSSQPGHVYEAVTSKMIVNYFPGQNLDLMENVAYDFVQPKALK